MEKDNKYYEIIKNIVKNHRKYYGYKTDYFIVGGADYRIDP